MAIYGYARISTDEQKLDLQTDALKAAGADHIFTDQLSGATSSRPGLDKLLKKIQAGDVLMVWKLDRLGRDVGNLNALLKQFRDRGIEFRSLTEGIDTKTLSGKLIFHIMSSIAEMERETTIERIQAGIAAAKRRGKLLGRRRSLKPIQMEQVLEMHKNGKSLREIGATFNVAHTTVRHSLLAHEAKQALLLEEQALRQADRARKAQARKASKSQG